LFASLCTMANIKTILLLHRDLLTAGLLGLSSGYVTSVTKLRFNTFGGMMTGNTVKLGMSMQEGDWEQAAIFACVLSCFALGTLFALIMLRQSAVRQRVWLFGFCALFVIVDGLAYAIRTSGGSATSESIVSALAAVALGAQNCISQKSNVVKANTTFMTGNIQKMVEAVYVGFTKGLKPAERRAALLLLITWSLYIVGGVVGAALSSCDSSFCTEWSLTPATVLYGTGMLSMLIEYPAKPKPAATAPPTAPEKTVPPLKPVPLDLEITTNEMTSATAPERVLSEDSVQGPHPKAPSGDGRRALGEDPQL